MIADTGGWMPQETARAVNERLLEILEEVS